MLTGITRVALLIAACGCAQEARQAPQQVAARHGSPMIPISDVQGGGLKSTDPLPIFCRIGDKDCLTPEEMHMKPCKLGADACPSDGTSQRARDTEIEKL